MSSHEQTAGDLNFADDTAAPPPTILAVVNDRDAMVQALCARKNKLDLSDAVVGELAGLSASHTGKLFGAARTKNLGFHSLFALAWALGAKVALVEDPETLQAVTMRATKRKRPDYSANRLAPLGKRTIIRMVPAIAREIGSRGGKARTSKLSPVERTRIARLGGLGRWAKKLLREDSSPHAATAKANVQQKVGRKGKAKRKPAADNLKLVDRRPIRPSAADFADEAIANGPPMVEREGYSGRPYPWGEKARLPPPIGVVRPDARPPGGKSVSRIARLGRSRGQ